MDIISQGVLELAAGLAPAIPRLRCGYFSIKPRQQVLETEIGLAPTLTLLQSVALLFGDSAVAERTGLEPACPCGPHVSTVGAYRLAYCRRLASNEGGLLLPNASVMLLAAPARLALASAD
jgi:hypothetical protein